ncbi:MAG TPA: arginine--tRNA ligase [Vicinamibacterales bacterium]|nr:arginine--tRNA ligase [Vicinamibacterales bacterium]
MILSVQRQIHEAISQAIRQQFGVADLPAFAVEVPPTRALGDLAVAVAFQLARTLRKAPKAIAQELAQALGPIPGIARVVATPNGYLNLYLERPAFFLTRVRGQVPAERAAAGKTIVEHTAINPNKAAHIGHLRNATLGDTLVRALIFRGTPVETQNYIDDTGVQVADVIVGFRELERRTLDDVRAIADTTRFDYYCWDLYSKVTEWYDGDQERLAIRAAVLHDLEHGGNHAAAMGAFIVDRIVRAHLETMARLNIGYDLLTYEGDILRLHFWAHAFATLKAQGAIFLQTEGKLAGCWVMKIEEGDADAADDPEQREKVIVRSNGVVTYVGKDLANQFWKFGLLGLDFRYRRFGAQPLGRPLWATTSGDNEPGAPPFGKAQRIYNVIDSRQMYLQALLSQALRTLGHPTEAENSIHFSYEMVALSHATARELGYESAADVDAAKKPFVEVSGRKGLGVKIDDLLDLLTTKATAEVATRNPELAAADCQRTGAQIAVGAIRYFMLKFSRGKLIVFDIEEALSFEGETGPYLQYAVVRAGNILRKLEEREGVSEADVLASLDQAAADEITVQSEEATHDLWAVVFEASRLDEVVESVVRSLEFSGLAKYAFGLAQTFNAFYHRYPILNEEQADRKRWRAAGVSYVRAQLTRALDLMGIDVPNRM